MPGGQGGVAREQEAGAPGRHVLPPRALLLGGGERGNVLKDYLLAKHACSCLKGD